MIFFTKLRCLSKKIWSIKAKADKRKFTVYCIKHFRLNVFIHFDWRFQKLLLTCPRFYFLQREIWQIKNKNNPEMIRDRETSYRYYKMAGWMIMTDFYWVHPKVAWLAQNDITKWSTKWHGCETNYSTLTNNLSYKNRGARQGFFCVDWTSFLNQ